MKPAPFSYHRAESAAHAAALLADFGEDGRILAGGQSLLPMMSLRIVAPAHVVDISKTADLMGVDIDDDGLAVGAAATYRRVAQHKAISQFPIIARAIGHVGHEPIRNRGTVVGSIAHNDPAGELPTVALALGAEVRLRSAGGNRSVSIDDFLAEAYTTTISDDEFVESVRFPRPGAGTRHGFSEFSRRPGDYASAGVACQVRYHESGSVAGCRVTTLAGGGSVRRHRGAEESIIAGGDAGLDIELAARAVAGSAASEHDRYHRRLIRHLAVDAFGQTAPSGREPRREPDR
jgi:carbon-monoxide dehydrogenase medium subunit